MNISRPFAAGTTILAATLLVTSCSAASGTPESSGDGELTPAAIQLGWLPNVENMAAIVADEKGYFEDQGIDVEILPGGPDVTADAQIAGGNALMGILSAEVLANSVAAGSGLVAIGAMYQTTSSAVVTLADSGIDDISDLEGRSLGMSQTDAVVYGPFFDLAGVDSDAIEQVMTGSDPASLASGEVDAITGTLANQPVVLAAQGYDVRSIPLADYGYNRWSGLLVVRESSLADPDERALVSSMLTALEAGLEDAVEDPEGAGQVVWDAYGEQLGLELETQVEGAKVWAELAQANSEQGLMKVDQAGLAKLQEFYTTVGIQTRAADVFDLSLGDEVL